MAPVNEPPVAAPDAYSVAEDTPFSFPGRGVLFNDSDPDGDQLSAELEAGPVHGVLVLESDGNFLYTPAPDFHGPDSFTYHATDGQAESNIATVSLNVNAVNDVPLARDDRYGVREDTNLTIAMPGVLINDSDIDGDPLTASLVGGALFGHVSLDQNGSFVYTPPTDFTGEDRFLYVVSDAGATSAAAEVTLVIQEVNDAPVVADDHFQATQGSPLTVSAPGALANDFDAEGDALNMSVANLPTNGTLVLLSGGGFTYTPAANYVGPDSFTYLVNDGRAFSSIATVSIDVTAGDTRPTVILGADAIVDEGSLFTRTGSFTDADGGDSWSATVDYGDSSGPEPLLLNANQSFALSHVYRDNSSYAVTVVVTDLSGAAGSATVQVQVRNVAPQALTFTGPALATRGQSLNFAGSFTDPGAADTHTARIDWGDGGISMPAVTTASGLRSVLASHTYSAGGIYEPTLTVTDDDGGVASKRTTVFVSGVDLDSGVLEIVGSAQVDTITVAILEGSLQVFGSLGGATLSQSLALGTVERIVAVLGSGNDMFTVSSNVPVPVLIDGGPGRDTLWAGGGPAILLGGSGDDALRGGPRRDLLIGGVGADQLNASAGGDLLIAGWTAYDANYDALAAIFAEWNAAAAYQDRITRLRSGNGSNVQPLGIKLAHNETVFNDPVADTLWGGSELDWFFLDLTRDQVKDKVTSESIG